MKPNLVQLIYFYSVIFNSLHQLSYVSGVEVATNRQQFTQFTQFECDNIPVCAISQPSESFSVTSKAQCVLYCQQRCQQPESCVGVNYKEHNKACDVFNYDVDQFKKNVTGCEYLQKAFPDPLNCLHIPPRDCNDVWFLLGNPPTLWGVYVVHVGSEQRPLSVYCLLKSAVINMTYEQLVVGSDFYRNLTNYATGINDLNEDLWIGSLVFVFDDPTNSQFSTFDLALQKAPLTHSVETWQVTVYTGTQTNAGTDAFPYLTIFGNKTNTVSVKTDEMKLDGPINNFEKGTADVFRIETIKLVKPYQIKVVSDNRGSSPDWYLLRVELKNLVTAEVFNFTCNCWLDATKGLVKTLPVNN